MHPPIKLISTDFDGTLFAEFEDPPIPRELEELLAARQRQGAKWVINTGRDMSSLMEALGRSGLRVEPDFLVLVEREIHYHEQSKYLPLSEWNDRCHRLHTEIFARVRPDLDRLAGWINERFHTRLYEDAFSPLCVIASSNGDMDRIDAFLNEYCREVPGLTVVRNDVYARFSHADFNKGAALTELTKRLGLTPAEVFAAGDHLNDLPMLDRARAERLAAPANAVEAVKEAVRRQAGYVSQFPHGQGVADALRFYGA